MASNGDLQTHDALIVDPPQDSLEQDQVFNKVVANLFGEEGQAPRIGNYYLLERVGAGAMGVVYAAYDPDLDRKVAVKFLKSREKNVGGSPHHQRLVREARALAKLSHANVVTVHGVGESDHGTYVAMEYIDGMDLAEWTKQNECGWRDIVAVYLQAARGLAAAHRAGIIHRDFKPHNVLLGRDGVVRVADFGLARGASDMGPAEPGGDREPAEGGNLTETGGVLGTPLYMAPEQHMGAKLGPAADQYAFCASLFETLHGRPPFSGSGMVALLESKLDRRLDRPARSDTPRWLSRIVERGLAPQPEDRFESMDALIAQIDAGLRPRRPPWWLALGVAALGGAAVSLWGTDAEPTSDVDPCGGLESKLVGVWDDEVRGGARAAMLDTKLSYAAHTWARVERRVDAYSAQWLETREGACRHHQNGEESAELFDRRVECLELRLGELQTLSETLRSADAKVVEHAVDLVGELVPVEQCNEPASLFTQRIRPDDLDDRREGLAMLERVSELAAHTELRPKDEMVAAYGEMSSELDTLVDHAARAELLHLGSTLAAETAQRVELARRARLEAVRSRDDTVVLDVSATLVRSLRDDGKYDQALVELDTAVATLDRTDSTRRELSRAPLRSVRAEYESLYGTTLSARGDHEESLSHFVRALELAEPDAHQKPRAYLIYLNNYGEVLRKTARYPEAIEHYDAALELAVSVYDADHPMSTTVRGNRGATYVEMGQFERGRADIEQVLVAQKAQLGPRDAQVGLNTFNLAVVDLATGRLDEAERELREAREIFVEVMGEESVYVAIVTATQGALARTRGDFHSAISLGEAAVAMLRAGFPGPHELLATGLTELGATHQEAGSSARAEKYLREALAVFEQSVGRGTSSVAITLTTLGAALTEQGRYEEAERLFVQSDAILAGYGPHVSRAQNDLVYAGLLVERGEKEQAEAALRRAIEYLEQSPVDPVLMADACAELARLLVPGSERDRLVARARESFVEAGPRASERLRTLDAWAG